MIIKDKDTDTFLINTITNFPLQMKTNLIIGIEEFQIKIIFNKKKNFILKFLN